MAPKPHLPDSQAESSKYQPIQEVLISEQVVNVTCRGRPDGPVSIGCSRSFVVCVNGAAHQMLSAISRKGVYDEATNGTYLIRHEPSDTKGYGTERVSIPCDTSGAVQRMEPLNNLQVAMKNDIDVFYFAGIVPLLVYFQENSQMEKREFLDMWKEIPEQNEQQFQIQNTNGLSADAICSKLELNNVFTVARRSVDGQELLYHSIKYSNNIFVLSELKMHHGSQALTLSLKSRHTLQLEI